MTILQISLPENIKALVEEQVNSGRFPTESAYLCRLIEEDERRRGQASLESLLASRIENPQSVEMNAADWAHMRDEFHRRLASRGTK